MVFRYALISKKRKKIAFLAFLMMIQPINTINSMTVVPVVLPQVITALEGMLVGIKALSIIVARNHPNIHPHFRQLNNYLPRESINIDTSLIPDSNHIFINQIKYQTPLMPYLVVDASAIPQTTSANISSKPVESAHSVTKTLTIASPVETVGTANSSISTANGAKDKSKPILYLNAFKAQNILILDRADIQWRKPSLAMGARVSEQTYSAGSLLEAQHIRDEQILRNAAELKNVRSNYQLLIQDQDLRIKYLNAVSDFCHTIMQTNNEIDKEKRVVARFNLLTQIPLFDQACTQLIGPAHYEIQDAIASINECYFDVNGTLKTTEVVAGATEKIAIALRRIYINGPIQNLVSLTKNKEYIFEHNIIPAEEHTKFKDVFFAERDAGFYKMLEVGQKECHSYGFSKFDLSDSSHEKIEEIKIAANPKEKRASGIFRNNPGPTVAAINSKYNKTLRSLIQLGQTGKYDEACELVSKISDQSVKRVAADIRNHYFSFYGIYTKGLNDPLWKTISSEIKETIQENRTLRNHMNDILAIRYYTKLELEKIYCLPEQYMNITGVDQILYELISLPNDPNIHIDFLLDKAKNKVPGWHAFFDNNYVLRPLYVDFLFCNSGSILIQNFKLNRNHSFETQIEVIRYLNKYLSLSDFSNDPLTSKIQKSLEYLVVANNNPTNSKISEIYLNLAKEMYDSLPDDKSEAAKILSNHNFFDISSLAAIEGNLPEIEKLLSNIEQEAINELLKAAEDINVDLIPNQKFDDLIEDSFKDLIALKSRKSLSSKRSGSNNLDPNDSGGSEGPGSNKTKKVLFTTVLTEAGRKNKKKAKEVLQSFKNKVVEKLNPFGAYERASYHTKVGNSIKSKAPSNGQAALDKSILVKSKGNTQYQRRIAIENDQFVILDEHMKGKFHGHVRTWEKLEKEMKEVLQNNNLVTNNGKIIKQ